MADRLDPQARRVFYQALIENRAGEVLDCLINGGSATVDPEGKLILFPAEFMAQLWDDAP